MMLFLLKLHGKIIGSFTWHALGLEKTGLGSWLSGVGVSATQT